MLCRNEIFALYSDKKDIIQSSHWGIHSNKPIQKWWWIMTFSTIFAVFSDWTIYQSSNNIASILNGSQYMMFIRDVHRSWTTTNKRYSLISNCLKKTSRRNIIFWMPPCWYNDAHIRYRTSRLEREKKKTLRSSLLAIWIRVLYTYFIYKRNVYISL